MAENLLATTLPYKSIRDWVPTAEVSSVYVDNISNMSQRESVMYQNDYRMTFNNTASGAVNKFTFNSGDQFLGQMWIEFEIGSALGGANKYVEFRSDYPAYDYIKKISWKIGATSEYVMNKESILNFIHEQCESDQKKLKLHQYAGNNLMKLETTTDRLKLHAFLPLPWSTFKANKIGNNQKPFPLHALGNQSIVLTVELENYSTLYTASTGNKIAPDAPSSINLNYKVAKVASNEELKMDDIYYPFKQAISGSQEILTGTTKHAISMKGFQSGECNAIILHCQGISGTDPFKGIAMHNIEVKLKGKTFYKANGRSGFIDLLEQDISSEYGKKLIKVAYGTTVVLNTINETTIGAHESAQNIAAQSAYIEAYVGPDASIENRNFYYVIPLSEVRLKMLESFNQYEVGSSFENQDVRLEFETVENTANKILNLTYVYNGAYKIVQKNGTSIIEAVL